MLLLLELTANGATAVVVGGKLINSLINSFIHNINVSAAGADW